jgi:hypothetical protein
LSHRKAEFKGAFGGLVFQQYLDELQGENVENIKKKRLYNSLFQEPKFEFIYHIFCPYLGA